MFCSQEKQPEVAAMPAAALYGSAGSEESGVGAAGANFQSNAFRALRAIALVCGSISIHVDANVHVAALELHAHEAAARAAGLTVTLVLP
jgi:hypothetical protein